MTHVSKLYTWRVVVGISESIGVCQIDTYKNYAPAVEMIYLIQSDLRLDYYDVICYNSIGNKNRKLSTSYPHSQMEVLK